jgi:hypothetical protein
LSVTRSICAAWRTGNSWHSEIASASNNSVKPLPSRAHGTGVWLVLPHAVQLTRGIGA